VRVFKLIIIASISLTLVGCVASEVPKLTDDTIEGELESGMPDGWSLKGAATEDYSVYIDRGIVNGGGASVSLASIDATDNRFSTLRQVIEAGEYAGNRVQFSAYLRTNRVQQSVGFWMRADSNTRGSIAFDNMDDRRIEGTTEWQQYSIVLDIPESAVVIYYGVLLEGTGQIWIDDCTLDVVSREIKTTGQYLDSFPREYQAPAGLLGVPTNMSFEGNMKRD
jgi:hypothetical protein